MRKWLFDPAQGFNLTASKDAGTRLAPAQHECFNSSDNTVYLIEAHRPPKLAALSYLEGGGLAPPAKFAHVSLFAFLWGGELT